MISSDRFDDLIIRVRTMEEVFGTQVLYANPSGFNKKTVEKWLRRDSYPRAGSLQAYCACVGLTTAQFSSSSVEFARALAGISEKMAQEGRIKSAFNQQQIEDIILGLQKGGGLMAVLNETIGSIGKKTLEKYHKEFSGFYMGHIHWTQWEEQEDKNARLVGADFKFLIRVGDLDPEHNVIQAKLTTYHHIKSLRDDSESPWAYQGVMIPLPGKLVFMFEVPNPSFEEMSFVFLICQNTPKNRLLGILTSDSSSPEDAPFIKVQPMPAASRVLLRKTESGDEKLLMKELAHGQPIDEKDRQNIQNDIHDETGILMTHSLPART